MPGTGQAEPTTTSSPAPTKPRRSRWIVGAVGTVLLALVVAAGVLYHNRTPPTLMGKWTGDVVWDSATGGDYRQPMRTALFFFPKGRFGTVLTFPTGAVGGSGTYALHGDRLSVDCRMLTINGHGVPLALFASQPWYHATAKYVVTFPGSRLELTPVAPGPVSAPGCPLLATRKSFTLGRAETAAAVAAPEPPRE